ncbi:glycosyltransferase [Microbacterium sp. CH12i]|uniref:glycosyltransferase n=1 Tax=Microbacterium sp. CH12i TaxID=1479651 RepID=UPI00055A4FB0|nr:glycosyltransferase [Microbacterium sp. CH12i]
MPSPDMPFPDADYVILSSRLIPDLDGGYTIAALARARQMATAGVHAGRGPLLLTVDPGTPAAHEQHRKTLDERGLITARERMRNLFDEAGDVAGGAATWLRAAAEDGTIDPSLEYRRVADESDAPIVSLPVITGDPDWHLTEAPIAIHGADGEIVGVIRGFGRLYRVWLEHVVEELRAAGGARPIVVICESRQLGEMLVDWDDPDVRLVHAIHTVHVEPPFTSDAPMNALWTRWFAAADRFDAIMWPTQAQRADVESRFGPSEINRVVSNAVEVSGRAITPTDRVAGRVVMLNRLAPGKRVDHAINAFLGVVRRAPEATLDIYGDGPELAQLQTLIDGLGLGGHVSLRGSTDDPVWAVSTASALLSTSAYEGQGLAILEALLVGRPVVSYDVPYGPRELLSGGGGLLVADGDVQGLSDAIVRVLTEPDLYDRLSAETQQASRAADPEHAMAALADEVRRVVERPSRRLS